MNEPPIERLNYFNGQRLEATDFRLEQVFHINVRRQFNKALFTPGIGAGLEVEKVLPEPAHAVRVLPGLALDSLGREIILVHAREVPVAGNPTEPADPVIGNYLVIEYAEETVADMRDGCAVRVGMGCKAAEDISWGAPSRILAEPKLHIQHQWPKPADNKIVLAQLELDKDCSVRYIRTFVRKYAAAAQSTRIRAFALEGEKDLDKDNPKDLYFRIEGGSPTSALLILRGLAFSTLYYTELGRHSHGLDIQLKAFEKTDTHSHSLLGEIALDEGGEHGHTGTMRAAEQSDVDEDEGELAGVEVEDVSGGERDLGYFGLTIEGGGHTHKLTLSNVQTDTESLNLKHSHEVITKTTAKAGIAVDGQDARTGSARSYLESLEIRFDGTSITASVLAQLTERDGPNVWQKLGDGTDGHKLSKIIDASGAVEGTGEIDLLRLGIDLTPGEHWIRLSVPSGGGKIQFNLYIE